MPPPPNTIDITGTTAELMAQNGGAGEMRGVNGEQLMNMGGEASATVKIEVSISNLNLKGSRG